MKRIVFFALLIMVMGTMMAQAPETTAQPFPSVNNEEFAKQIKKQHVVLVDVRTTKEFAEGHIEGALNVVWGADFDKQVEEQLTQYKGQTLAVYCRSGRRSKQAGKRLAQLGYKVVELDAGILGWQKEGKAVVK